MSIHLNDEDRAHLERLEKRRMRPTRRQKAIALLRLSAGLSPAEAAKHAGISKEDVQALAQGFAKNGLAGVGLKPKILIRLVRPGVGVETLHLEEGTTLADLLHRYGTALADQSVMVDGVQGEETMPLRDGALVTIAPRLRNAAVDEPWRATIPSFRDESLFQEYVTALKRCRRDLGPDQGPEA